MAESLDRAHRRRRREALRRVHPDLGGTSEEFARVFRSFAATPHRGAADRGATAGAEVRFVRAPRGLARLPAWFRTRRRRATAPRRVV